MLTYVLNKDNKPLMPTERCNKVAYLLKHGLAKVVQRTPFTIKLLYDTPEFTQDITLGIKPGSAIMAVSASTESKELYATEVRLRTDVVKNIATRRQLRRTRRYRKTRYRKPRFNNRRRPEGWLPPSVKQKIDTHLKIVSNTHKILPVSKIIIETTPCDIQKIKNDAVAGIDYHNEEQLGFKNIREYVLSRDKHTCQHCKSKSKNKKLRMHHIETRKTGGNSPSNLVTVCETCHEKFHQDKIKFRFKRGKSFKAEAFLSIMKQAFYDRLQALYREVKITYGYLTKDVCTHRNLSKTYTSMALCITRHFNAKQLPYLYKQKAMRTRNRQIHKAKFKKGGKRLLNQQVKYNFGFQLFDKVKWNGIECFISGRRTSGSFALRDIDYKELTNSITYKKLKLLEKRKTLLCNLTTR